MTGDIKLTAFNRQGSRSYISEVSDDDFPKPRIKLIHPSGEVRYFLLETTTEQENPKFSVIIDGINHYIGKNGWFIDFIFSSASKGLLNLKPNGYVLEQKDFSYFSYIATSGSNPKLAGGVLAQNGKIYCVPSNEVKILEIDTELDTTRQLGDLSGTNKFLGGVLAPNGKIYFVPRRSSSVCEFDPNTETLISIGSLGGGYEKWEGGVLAPNGKIYCIPTERGKVLVIDSSVNEVQLTEIGALDASHKYSGGAISKEGNIYGIPIHASNVLKIDPENSSVTTFGNVTSTRDKWGGGVSAPNGKIYGIPFIRKSVLEINTEDDSLSEWGENNQGTNYRKGVLAPNGKIYCIPSSGSVTLEIDYENKTFLNHSIPRGLDNQGVILAPNGKIYCIPSNEVNIATIYTGNISNYSLISPFYNKF